MISRFPSYGPSRRGRCHELPIREQSCRGAGARPSARPPVRPPARSTTRPAHAWARRSAVVGISARSRCRSLLVTSVSGANWHREQAGSSPPCCQSPLRVKDGCHLRRCLPGGDLSALSDPCPLPQHSSNGRPRAPGGRRGRRRWRVPPEGRRRPRRRQSVGRGSVRVQASQRSSSVCSWSWWPAAMTGPRRRRRASTRCWR